MKDSVDLAVQDFISIAFCLVVAFIFPKLIAVFLITKGLAYYSAVMKEEGIDEEHIAGELGKVLCGLVPFVLLLSIFTSIDTSGETSSFSGQELLEKGLSWFLVLLSSFALSYLARLSLDITNERKYPVFSGLSFSLINFISNLGLALFRKFRSSQDELVLGENAQESRPMQIGYERKAFLSESNLNYHVQIIGGSGSGKTNLLKVMLEDRISRGHSVIFFDFKADFQIMDWVTGVSEAYHRRDDLQIVTMSNPDLSHAYNPVSLGSETEITSQIINAFTWTEEFYKNVSESGLMIICKALCFLRDKRNKAFTLGDIYLFLVNSNYRMEVIESLNKLNYPEWLRSDLRSISEELSSKKRDNYQGLISQFSKILNSSAGDIVSSKCGEDVEFSFRDCIESGGISYLFMNSLKLKETASILGKLMLQDLMKTVGNIYDDRNFEKRPTTVVIDEFASFATPDFGEFIEKARGAGISIVVAYQSKQSLDHIEENLALKLNENTATKIIFQVQNSEDAEWFCSLVGTKTVQKETSQIAMGIFEHDTGMKSVRDVEEFIIHPNTLKRLQMGQALLVCSKVDPHFCLMNIIRASDYASIYEKKTAPTDTYYNGSYDINSDKYYESKAVAEDKPIDLKVEDLV